MHRFIKSSAAVVPVLGLALAGLSGCQSSMHEENVGLHGQNRQLQAMLSDTRDELQTRPDAAQLASLQSQLAARDQMIADLQSKLDAPQADGTRVFGIDGVEIDFNTARGEMTMRVPGDVLFASGSVDVNKSAEATLARIAEVLNKEYGAKTVRVEGHTDSDPIRRTANLYKDNRDLSMRRAHAVTKVLEGKGVKPGRIESVGHGEHRPLGRTKKDDRRVEIVVVM